MSEHAPRITPEVIEKNPNGLPPRDEAINTVRGEINNLETELNEAEARVSTPGFRATANDIIQNRENLRNLRETNGPRLEGLQSMWEEFGGPEIDRAQAAVDALNFKSDANDRVAATLGLRDAKDAFYAKLEGALADKQADVTRVYDQKDARVLADIEEADRNGRNSMEVEQEGHTDFEAQEPDLEPEEKKHKVKLFVNNADDDDGKLIYPDDEYPLPPFSKAQRNTNRGYADDDESARRPVEEASNGAPSEVEVPFWIDDGDQDLEGDHVEARENKTTNHNWSDEVRARMNSMLANGKEWFNRQSKRNKIFMAIGLVAAAGTTYALAKHGLSHDSIPGADGSVGSGSGSKNLGDFAGATDSGSAAAGTPDFLPSSTSHAHPFGWAAEAFGSDNAMSSLHELGAKAAHAGHDVQWHGSGPHQWVEVDGNSKTKHVIDVFRQFAK